MPAHLLGAPLGVKDHHNDSLMLTECINMCNFSFSALKPDSHPQHQTADMWPGYRYQTNKICLTSIKNTSNELLIDSKPCMHRAVISVLNYSARVPCNQGLNAVTSVPGPVREEKCSGRG